MKFASYISKIAAMALLCIAAPQAQEGPASDASEAANARVLEIRNGDVLLDGHVLPSNNLPGGLHLDGIDMTYHFSGPVTPVLEIDGEVYVLDGDRLIRMDEAAPNRANVYFLGQPEQAGRRAAVNPVSIASADLDDRDEVLEEAGEEAYMRQLSTRDQNLYNQIQREQFVELETYRLAGEYRNADRPAERRRIEDALRTKLDESFELKQQIRADEIEQAEVQIGELRRLLNERSARKRQIIERRLLELIGKRGN